MIWARRAIVLDADEIRVVWPWLETLPPAVADILKCSFSSARAWAK